MVVGLDTFKDRFKDHQDKYIVIGGVACDQQFEEKGLPFRVTKDIDMILIIEALDEEFVSKFWDFIAEGEYEQKEVDEKRNCYRFCKPKKEDFPAEIELFSRKPDVIAEKEGMHLTPIPTDANLSSLSAILLEDEYYDFTINHSEIIDGLHVASDEAILCLKARAYLDLSQRKADGAEIDKKKINKHRSDIIRLAVAIEGDPIELPESLRSDIEQLIDKIETEQPDIKNIVKDIGIPATLEDIISVLRQKFGIE